MVKLIFTVYTSKHHFTSKSVYWYSKKIVTLRQTASFFAIGHAAAAPLSANFCCGFRFAVFAFHLSCPPSLLVSHRAGARTGGG